MRGRAECSLNTACAAIAGWTQADLQYLAHMSRVPSARAQDKVRPPRSSCCVSGSVSGSVEWHPNTLLATRSAAGCSPHHAAASSPTDGNPPSPPSSLSLRLLVLDLSSPSCTHFCAHNRFQFSLLAAAVLPRLSPTSLNCKSLWTPKDFRKWDSTYLHAGATVRQGPFS